MFGIEPSYDWELSRNGNHCSDRAAGSYPKGSKFNWMLPVLTFPPYILMLPAACFRLNPWFYARLVWERNQTDFLEVDWRQCSHSVRCLYIIGPSLCYTVDHCICTYTGGKDWKHCSNSETFYDLLCVLSLGHVTVADGLLCRADLCGVVDPIGLIHN